MTESRASWPRAVAQLVLGAALFAAVLYWLAPSWSAVASAVEISVPLLCLALLGTTVGSVVTAARWKLLTEAMGGSSLPFVIYFRAFVVARFVAQFLPAVLVDVLGRSAGLRAAGSHAPLGRLATVVVVERVLDLALPLVMLGWAVAVEAGAPPWISLGVVVVAFGLGAVPLLPAMARVALRVYGYARRLRRRDDDVPTEVALPRELSARVVGLGLARYVALTIQYWALGAGVGVILSAIEILSATPPSQLAALASITPGGLGLQEGGWAAALTVKNVDPTRISLFLISARAGLIASFGLLSLIAWPMGSRFGRRPKVSARRASGGRESR